MFTQEQIEGYLSRLGYVDMVDTSAECLKKLQERHYRSIAYESLDIWTGKEVTSLANDALYEKIIVKRRGGYCFELNGLFAELLRSLGFDVKEYFARWHFGESEPIPYRRHRALEVTTKEGDVYLADVGVGCVSPQQPLEMKMDVPQLRGDRYYRIVKDDALGYVVQVKSETGIDFVNYFSFFREPNFPHDFDYVHYYCSKSDASPFRKKLFVGIWTEIGRKNVEYKASEKGYRFCNSLPSGGYTSQMIYDEADLRRLLLEEFGLDY